MKKEVLRSTRASEKTASCLVTLNIWKLSGPSEEADPNPPGGVWPSRSDRKRTRIWAALTFAVCGLYEGCLGRSRREAAQERGAGDQVGRKAVVEGEESKREKQEGGDPGRESKRRRRRAQPGVRGTGEPGLQAEPGTGTGLSWRAPPGPGLRVPLAGPPATAPYRAWRPRGGASRGDAVFCPPPSARGPPRRCGVAECAAPGRAGAFRWRWCLNERRRQRRSGLPAGPGGSRGSGRVRVRLRVPLSAGGSRTGTAVGGPPVPSVSAVLPCRWGGAPRPPPRS